MSSGRLRAGGDPIHHDLVDFSHRIKIARDAGVNPIAVRVKDASWRNHITLSQQLLQLVGGQLELAPYPRIGFQINGLLLDPVEIAPRHICGLSGNQYDSAVGILL